ncbi:MAG: hypothetical protein IPQ07_28225 [Myxococcales bacterium]|nr:hypothetical protein [Myxococcales bacterium]
MLEVEADADDAFEALVASYRIEERWNDLRALLERRTEVTVDDRVRLASLLELAALEEDVLGQPTRAAAAHRRVLELDPSHLGSYQALDRLYQAAEQWKELEELLSRQIDPWSRARRAAWSPVARPWSSCSVVRRCSPTGG